MEDVNPLVSIEDAKRQLREHGEANNTDVEQKLSQATALVLGLVGSLADEDWTESTLPAALHTAILWTTDVLYLRPEELSSHMVLLSKFLIASGYRDPAVA